MLVIVATVDGGKSALRLRITNGNKQYEGMGPGYAHGEASQDDLHSIVEAIREALDGARREARGQLATPAADVAFVGLTGVPGDPDDREQLEGWLTGTLAQRVFAFDDGVLAHAGALGAAGTVATVGTGTHVVTVTPNGEIRSLDGWGPMIGDRGSAYAIGLAGIRAAAVALDGAGPTTAIVDQLDEVLDGSLRSLSALQAFLRRPDITAQTAAFAGTVLRLAVAGDPVAAAIERQAAADLAATLLAAALPGYPVSWSGRLLDAHPHYLSEVRAACPPDLAARLLPPAGKSLDGGPVLARSLSDDDTGIYRAALVAWAKPAR